MAEPPPMLIYDGECGFCTTSVGWVSRHWSEEHPPTAIPWQTLSADRAAALHLTEDDFARSVWWADGERVEEGSRAIARALVATSGCRAIAGRLLLVPPISWLALVGYRVVARYRYRLPGGTPACKGLTRPE